MVRPAHRPAPSVTAARHRLARLAALLALALLSGCTAPSALRSRDRYKNGVVYVLPGIEGKSPFNRNLAIGLDEGGVRSAIEVHDWTYGVPGANVFNLINIDRNRREARYLVDKIVRQRDRYPGSPVVLIGHSGGGGIAVLALEALPPGRQIDLAVLLAPAISPEYDLSASLRRTRAGIHNFYSNKDIGLLMVGTTVFGNVDRDRGPSAGAVGFRLPDTAAETVKSLYGEKLKQVAWGPRLREVGASGTHMGWTSREFAREYLAPLILRAEAAAAAEASLPPRSDPPELPARNAE